MGLPVRLIAILLVSYVAELFVRLLVVHIPRSWLFARMVPKMNLERPGHVINIDLGLETTVFPFALERTLNFRRTYKNLTSSSFETTPGIIVADDRAYDLDIRRIR